MESFRFGQSIRALLSDLWTIDDEEITLACADGYLWRLEVCLRELLAMESLGVLDQHCSSGSSVLRCISEAHRRMLAVVDDLQCHFHLSDEHSERTPSLISGGVGRPRFDIPQSQLEFLLQVGFSVPRISCLLGVSVSTVRRRMTLYGFSVQSLYTPLNNEQLDAIVSEIQVQFPTAGNRQMCGLLRARGIRIQFHRIREAQRRVDPEGSFMRRLHSLYRRRYSVAGPQHLWHIDGNHKLIRWRLVIHGGVDGYSRMIVYLKCANNNCATTVLQVFQSATQEFGIPSRVRADRGGENTAVAEFIVHHRGSGRGSFISGRSVHNQRIERMWRDVFGGCTILFYSLFLHMEDEGLLDPSNELHLFCLQYVFIPRINESLSEFCRAWNSHPLSTESNHTPIQLWLAGCHPQEDEVEFTSNQYGVDWDGPLVCDDDNVVVVPTTNSPLSEYDMEELASRINPLAFSDELGIDLYVQTVHFVSSRIS